MTDSTWGSGNAQVVLRGNLISIESDAQVIPGTRTNAKEIDRQTRKGIQGYKLGDFSGGLALRGGIGDISNDLNKFTKNQGVVTRIPGLAYLPYLPVLQTSVTSDEDISAFVAANKRIHSLTTALGVTGLRWIAGLGVKLYGDTSLTDGTLLVRDTFTNTITAGALLYLNSTWYAAFATNGQTDDIKGTTSVTGSGAPSWTELVTNSDSSDATWAMQFMQELGSSGVNVFVGSIGAVNQTWYALGSATVPATLMPLVADATKNVPGSLATTTTSATSPAYAYDAGGGDLAGIPVPWTGPDNILASDDTDASHATLTAGSTTNWLGAGFDGQFTAIPRANVITGILYEVEVQESNADDNMFLSVRMRVNGTLVGPVRTYSAELGTSDAYLPIGSSTDHWGVDLTGEDVQNISFECQFVVGTSGASANATPDHVRVTLTHRPPGTALKFNQGGCRLEPMPTAPNRMVMLEPAADDKTAITQPRRLVYLDVKWDEAGNQPVGSKTYPDVGGLAYIHHGCPLAGGYAITGGDVAGPGENIYLIKSDGKVLNLKNPTLNGTLAFKCNRLYTLNGYLGAEMVASDFSEQQHWFWDIERNVWFPDTAFTSIISGAPALSTQPIPWAESKMNVQQSINYIIWPNSTDTAVRREFIPQDMHADPRLTNTTQTLYPSAIYLDTLEMYAGYADASNSILRLDYQERRIGTSSSTTGTVRLQIETGGDAAFSSPAVNPSAFSAGLHATPSSRGYYEVPGGAAYQTVKMRLTLDQGSGTTTSGPNGLPWLITTAQDWPDDLRVFGIQLEGSEESILSTLEALETLRRTKNIQHLKAGNVTCLASYDKVTNLQQWMASSRGGSVRDGEVKLMPIVWFIEKPGSVT